MLGPVMLDIAGCELTEEDRNRLQHPLVGGVILFARNYASPAQLQTLTEEIHALRNPPLIIAIDQEGGRVQRCRAGFTRLPPMRALGELWDTHPHKAKQLAELLGFVLASELRACGVDFSFTPVLDLDFGSSTVIGDRAFHSDPQAVADLAHQLILGLKRGGMANVGKHFPGHGYVVADSHIDVPVDERNFADIEMQDLLPFRQLIDYGLTAIMPAHVIYPAVDDKPAGFSPRWIGQILRRDMQFDGVVFSDDLSMEGARVAGGIVDRALAALHAGCDMVLVCNNPQAADELLRGLQWDMPAVSLSRLILMHGMGPVSGMDKLHEQHDYAAALHAISGLGLQSGELPLNA